MNPWAEQIVDSRKELADSMPRDGADPVQEGGCGVVGFAADVPVRGRNIFEASIQMHNRGNGKGGGIAAAGLDAAQMGVDADTLRDDYLLQVALLDASAEGRVEETFIAPSLRIDHKQRMPHVDDYRDAGLDVCPPEITRYFVRVKDDALAAFAEAHGLEGAPSRLVEDEFIYRNSFGLNRQCYAALGEKQAFVMSHARDLMIVKVVGYAEQLVRYYRLEDMLAHVWIAHQRYPTKGRVWHPAGAHPFIGLNEALVHNGDFANYHSITEHLRQHNVVPQFLTDTEVSVLLFDLLRRTYEYPLEYVIEALAPTTGLDFQCLSDEKKKVYRAIQSCHIHGSPDGPWFFIIARSDPDRRTYRLIGITDTAMLRPQVFALQEGGATIGLVGSEKQAIDATLKTLSREDPRFRPVADRYWNARGGSHTDGGAFVFTVERSGDGATLRCTDKFGADIRSPGGEWRVDPLSDPERPDEADVLAAALENAREGDMLKVFRVVEDALSSWDFARLRWLLAEILRTAAGGSAFPAMIELLSLMNDRRYSCGRMKRSVLLQLVRRAISDVLDAVPRVNGDGGGPARRIDWETRRSLRAPVPNESLLVIDASGFPPEGDECDARLLVSAHEAGWRRFIVHGLRGQRFTGCGLGRGSDNVRIDVFGSSGDYLASGIDGLEIHVHDSAQDQLGQIMKQGALVVHGDVGQTFMYGAKGGEVYVLGNAAGRPLINAVGSPRVVINGTCLDFLAESFMAGDALNGGGFVVLNGVTFNEDGGVIDLDSPYPGGNLFSLASGGAIYVRDPYRKLVAEQLNGGKFVPFTEEDWTLIEPYLVRNEAHFGISVNEDLLSVGEQRRRPGEVYRKVCPAGTSGLEDSDVTE